jgi:hydrogenase maturation protease
VSETVVICVGNANRGDDGFGPAVARRLLQASPEGTHIRECSGAAGELMEAWRGARCAIVIDAAIGLDEPGSVRRLEAGNQPLPAGLLSTSTHGLGVAEAVELARALGELPPRVVVYAAQGRSFQGGAGLCDELRLAVDVVVSSVLLELAPTECT